MSIIEINLNDSETLKRTFICKIKLNQFKCCVIFLIIFLTWQIFQFSPDSTFLNIITDKFKKNQVLKEIISPQVTVKQMQNKSTMALYIHQSWKTHQVPSNFSKWSKSWQQCFPKWNYTLWTDEDNRNLVKQHYPGMLNFYDQLPTGLYRPNAIRYLYLYHYGGLYADLDVECLRPFDHLLVNYSLVFGAMKVKNKSNVTTDVNVENFFMYSTPKHPFWMELISDMMVITSDKLDKWTGSNMLEKSIKRYRKKYLNDIKIYEPNYFNPFNCQASQYEYCYICKKMKEEDLKKCRKYFYDNGTYVLHYHTTI